MARAFVIRPFGRKQNSSGRTIDFELVHEQLISPALTEVGVSGSTTGDIIELGNIREDMFALLLNADLVICDVSIHDANVFYELGVRHALRKRYTVLIKGNSVVGTPFDLLTERYVSYDMDHPGRSKEKLINTLNAALSSERANDSPIFLMLPRLEEADLSTVLQAVPPEFREDVDRARAARVKGRGWLRFLAEEVTKVRFQFEGLKLVASAQWDLKDYEGAREGFEAVRATYPNDLAANLALANIYERLYRERREPEILVKSDQAIERVLLQAPDRRSRAEALALKARNHKTRWRIELESQEDLKDRRQAAMSAALISSYEAYRDAYFEDLNVFWPGVAALQLGVVMLDLASDNAWYEAFADDDQADAYHRKLSTEIAALKVSVPLAIEAELRRLPSASSERVWAELTQADLQFLTDQSERRVATMYRNAIPRDMPFIWDAARGQLELFAYLGVKMDLARKVIEEIDARFADRIGGTRGSSPIEPSKAMHILLFAGHRVDDPTRVEPRFPAYREHMARELMRSALQGVIEESNAFVSLASAAPGADIMWHELCGELGVPSTICLPMPPHDYARVAFEGLDTWRTRFLDLIQHREVLVLSNGPGLPRWLAGSGTDPSERGNLWLMKMAQACGAHRITLVALWDGKSTGDGRGGTAHMVELARQAGTVHIQLINAEELLA